ncbi:MAG: ABC transporter substrate-binding protein [Betaproteobacteria bacterium]
MKRRTPAATLTAVLVALLSAASLASTPARAADMNKTLRVAVSAAETGFDPQAISDLYSSFVTRVIFDPLYQYDYLARPFKIVPNTAVALPEISDDGKKWIIKVKPGIQFTDDPAFKGKKRELTAYDYIYSWKRLIDPKLRAPNIEVVTDRFIGEDAFLAAAKSGANVYDVEFQGMKALDRYTIELSLKAPDYDLLDDLTSNTTAAVAREVVEAYGDASHRVMANPIGTGPYLLKEWRRSQKVVVEASPTFREQYFPDSDDPADAEIMKVMKGKRIPMIGRIEMIIIEEANPRLLAFINGELDVSNPVPPDLIHNVLDGNDKLRGPLAKRGIQHVQQFMPSITFEYFNMDDPIVGGYSREQIALRRAISMAYNVDDEVTIVRQGQGAPATQMLPPPVIGHDPKFVDAAKFDPAAANRLLDKMGYLDRDGDGWRELPDGRPLKLTIYSPPANFERQLNELWKKSLDLIHIRVEFVLQKFPDLLKQARAGQLQMWGLGNTAGTPEGFGFFGMLYGPNSGLSNLPRFNLPQFNALYDKGKRMKNGPERDKVIRQLSKLVSIYAPMKLTAYRYDNVLLQPWMIGFKYTPFNWNPWRYWDFDLAVRDAATRKQ